MATTLDALEPDAFAAVCEHLQTREVAALATSCAALRHAVSTNDRLWAQLFAAQFPAPWRHLTQQRQPGQQPGQQGASVAPGGWREMFLRTHDACQQLASTRPACREWTTDASAVTFAAVHGTGDQRLTVTAQGSGVELRCSPELNYDKSYQLYGHSARVSSAAVLTRPGALRRIGCVTASHDQTIRLWAANADPDSFEFRHQPLSLLTPLRTLRGHAEALTSLQLIRSSTGVTIAATGSKDRTVRLWALAPLLPSPVQKPQIATLRGHGAPITCLALCTGGGDDASSSGSSGGGLLSGSLDARVKQWDPWTAACTGTAKCAAPVAALQPAAAAPALQPHCVLVAGGAGVQLLDLRSMRAVGGVALPAERAEAVHCMSQWGWDLAVGASDGARVFDLRGLTSAFSGASTSSSASGSGSASGRAAGERLRLTGHARPVTSIHVDRLKVVTGTDRYGPSPVRVWCADTGEALAQLETSLPPAAPPAAAEAADAEPGGGGAGEGAAAAGQQGQQVGGDDEAAPDSPPARPHHQYNRGWEGATALAVRGALLVSGSSEGTVLERDFSRGGLPELEAAPWERCSGLAGKFWQLGGGGRG